ncbi:unnamed protein product [Pseudo-nitzschia multistriata]|uniref:Uncharacterized protein n=1 Tax=Pseudo-nitzschia multistriata TaxID=183589 RepID=A0A448YWE3_9STRA|nr:unnamed protein product [Pseudo-nitzschia multistriata]
MRIGRALRSSSSSLPGVAPEEETGPVQDRGLDRVQPLRLGALEVFRLAVGLLHGTEGFEEGGGPPQEPLGRRPEAPEGPVQAFRDVPQGHRRCLVRKGGSGVGRLAFFSSRVVSGRFCSCSCCFFVFFAILCSVVEGGTDGSEIVVVLVCRTVGKSEIGVVHGGNQRAAQRGSCRTSNGGGGCSSRAVSSNLWNAARAASCGGTNGGIGNRENNPNETKRIFFSASLSLACNTLQHTCYYEYLVRTEPLVVTIHRL